jgi:hypothetical protein
MEKRLTTMSLSGIIRVTRGKEPNSEYRHRRIDISNSCLKGSWSCSEDSLVLDNWLQDTSGVQGWPNICREDVGLDEGQRTVANAQRTQGCDRKEELNSLNINFLRITKPVNRQCASVTGFVRFGS